MLAWCMQGRCKERPSRPLSTACGGGEACAVAPPTGRSSSQLRSRRQSPEQLRMANGFEITGSRGSGRGAHLCVRADVAIAADVAFSPERILQARRARAERGSCTATVHAETIVTAARSRAAGQVLGSVKDALTARGMSANIDMTARRQVGGLGGRPPAFSTPGPAFPNRRGGLGVR